ncbi:MAG TPA: hypothetical protein VKB88_10410 [Bryobacteraceae bacterium]|nr:hypothetical protein [Bryobacteraceae bacterium]
MRKTIEVAFATIILALCLTKAAGAPLDGTWEGTVNGQKALKVTIESTLDHLHGTMVMYVVEPKFGEPGAHIVGQLEHRLSHIKRDGKTLYFSIEEPDVNYEMTLTGPNRGVLKQHAHDNSPELTVPVQRR